MAAFDTEIIDMRRVGFLMDNATDMPSAARRLCEHFGHIVQAATAAW